jgi:Flp pilus assembly pilin Flp
MSPEWNTAVRSEADPRDESGQTMVEYALLLSLITAGLVLAMTGIGTTLVGFFSSFQAAL